MPASGSTEMQSIFSQPPEWAWLCSLKHKGIEESYGDFRVVDTIAGLVYNINVVFRAQNGFFRRETGVQFIAMLTEVGHVGGSRGEIPS